MVVKSVRGCESAGPSCRSTERKAVYVGFQAAVAGGSVAVLAAHYWPEHRVTAVAVATVLAALGALISFNPGRLRLARVLMAVAVTVLTTRAVRVTGGAASEAYVLYFLILMSNLMSDGCRLGCLGLEWAVAGLYACATIPSAVAGHDGMLAVAILRTVALLAVGVGTNAISHQFSQCSRAATAASAKLMMRNHWDEAMLRISRRIDSGLGLAETLELLLEGGLGVLHADIGLVALKGRSGDFMIRAERNVGNNVLGKVIGPSEGAVGLCLELRSTVVYPSGEGSGRRFPEVDDYGLEKVISTPLFAGSDMVGAIAFGDTRAGHPYSPDDVEFIESLAKQLSVVAVNANLLEEARRRADYLTSLNQISMGLTSVLESYELFERIYLSVCQVLPLDAFFVALPTDDPAWAEMAFIMDKGVRSPPSRLPMGDTPTGKVMGSGRPLLANLNEAGDSEGFSVLGDVDDPEVTRSIMIAPMRTGSRVVGAISAQSYATNAYTEEELELLITIAGSAAVALENSRLYQAAREQSMTDQLTGLGNYRLFHEVFGKEVERARRYSTPLSLIMVDSDSLKTINDTHGHGAGDLHLQHITRLMTTLSRRSDYVVRYAGDEFMIILPNTGGAEAMIMAERLRAAVEQSTFAADGREVSATVSVGVASYPDSGSDVEAILKCVDDALYSSKRAGKNRVTRA